MKSKHASVALHNVRKFFPEVKSIQDGDSDLHITVTAADVKNSTKKDHNNCAMAVAAKRTVKSKGVVVARSVAYVIKHDAAIRYKIPESVEREIISFDRGASFEEGEYVLKAPPKSMRLGARQERAVSPSEHKPPTTGKKVFIHLATNVRAAVGSKS